MFMRTDSQATLAASMGTMSLVAEVVDRKRHEDVHAWSLVCAGDSHAFEDLYRAHVDALFVFCLRRLGVFQDAEDVVARTFEELWKQRHRVQCDEERGLRPWLYTVARRQCGRVQAAGEIVTDVTDILVGPGVDVVVEDVLNEHAQSALLDAMDRLSGQDREVAAYSFVDGLSSSQIAKRVGRPASTIRSRLGVIRSQLESDLRRAGYGPGGESHD